MLTDAVKEEITVYQSVDRLTGQASTLGCLRDRLERVVDYFENRPKPPKNQEALANSGSGLNNTLANVCEINGQTMAEIDTLISKLEYQLNLTNKVTETGRR